MARGAQGEVGRSAKLRDSERNFRLLVQSVTDYAIYMIDPQGTVASWNAGAERIKGYLASEIIGRNFSEFFTPEDRAEGVPARALQSAREHGRYESEGWRIRKDGTRFWSLAVIDAVHDDRGRLLGFAKITRDMTERREAQLRLQRAQEELAQAQKMEAIGHLTGGIAHDFNNLLMIVSGQVQLMRMRAKDPKDIRALDSIALAAKSGANLTRQLLTFSRRQSFERVTINVREQLDALSELLRTSVGPGVSLSIEVDKDVWPVNTDVSELERALVNIAVNAHDAMPNGGKLVIRARNVPGIPGEKRVEGDFVELSIADTGAGIAPEVVSKVFEPFFTTKEIGRGTGLGLSQVYGFTRQAGGDVTISSEIGKGTVVRLYLPKCTSFVAPPSQVASLDAPDSDGGTVLVVEDNMQVGEVAAMLLEQLGYKALVVERGAAALDLLERRNDFALVMSDIVMPGDLDGLDLAHAVRSRFPALPILLTTGYSSAAERAGSEFPIMRKPYDLQALGKALRLAMGTVPANLASMA